MIDIITPRNRDLYRHTLREMFRLRYRVFIEKYGWRVKTREPGLDIDDFDTDTTIYLVRTLDDGTVTAGCRFNPTTHPHMLSTVFSHYCAVRGAPTGPDIYECSRLIFNELDISRTELLRARGEFMYGIVEFCMRAGISKISWMTYFSTYQRYIRLWPSQPLGLPQEEPDGTFAAAVSKMNDEALQNMAARCAIPQPLLQYIGPQRVGPELLDCGAQAPDLPPSSLH